MALGLENIIGFGKHRNETVNEVLKSDPGYLLWLRDEKFKDGNGKYFSDRVLKELNTAIGGSKALRKQFVEFPIDSEAAAEPQTKEEILAALKAGKVAEKESERAADTYKDQWGAF